MKVLVVNIVPFRLNGVSAVIMNYYKAMNKEDLQMDFFTSEEPIPEYKEQFEAYGIQYYVVPKRNLLKYFFGLQKIARKGKYDIAHVHGNNANMAIELFACMLAGIKVRIAHTHNISTHHPYIHKMLYPLFMSSYTHGIACGEDAGKWLFHDRPFVELKNGVDLEKYKYNQVLRNECRNCLNIENKVVIGHIGTFNEQKNHLFLIDIFAKIIEYSSQYCLLLLGDGDLMNNIKEKVHTLGLEDNVIFIGKTTDVTKYLCAMDVLILPSLHEGLPVVLIEAQASGLPCIVADTVTKEVDLTGSMKFVPLGNVKKWTDIVFNSIYYSDKERSQISTLWQEKLTEEGYDIDKNAYILKNLYKKILA